MPFIIIFTLLILTIFWVNNPKIYRALYIVLNLALLTLIYNTFIIYTADFEISPWHSSGKVAYLVVVLEVLWMLAINAILGLLSRKIYINPNQILLPFIAAVTLGFYLIFYINPPVWLCIGGAFMSVILFFALIALFFINFDKTFHSK